MKVRQALLDRVAFVLDSVLDHNADVYSLLNPTKDEFEILKHLGLTLALDAADAFNFMIEHSETKMNGVVLVDARQALAKYAQHLRIGNIHDCELLRRLI